MNKFDFRRATHLLLIGGALWLAARPAARAQAVVTVSVLAAFEQTEIDSGLVLANDGALYGVTTSDAVNDAGTAFKVTTGHKLTVLHTFNGTDGSGHKSALIQGSDGNFYGTTYAGGSQNDGTVYRMTPAGALTTLHSFRGGTEGESPDAALVQGSDGDFYGVTTLGGTGNDGTVFKLTPEGVLSTLYSFTANGDGKSSSQPLARGSDGNFYGVTDTTVFKITPAGALTTIHRFNLNAEGSEPQGGLVQGSDGNFYGTANSGPRGCGTVFKVTPAGKLTLLADFYYGNGWMPVGTLVFDGKGNLYGATSYGGTHNAGTMFRVSPAGELAVLYNSNGIDGAGPGFGVVLDSSGNLYGVGNGQTATVFELTVGEVHPPFFLGEELLGNGVYYLAFGENLFDNTIFGYYGYLSDSRYIYHFDLGYEYIFDANDGQSGVYFYDFASSTFFYTSPEFSFPYLYDFTLKAVLYYYPDPNNAGRYNTNGVRYFYNFATGQVITK